MGFNEVSWTSWCSDGAVEMRRGFSKHKSPQEIDVQMFLEILLANHLHIVVLDCLWKLLVARSFRDGAMTSSEPCVSTMLIQCRPVQQRPFQVEETMKPGHSLRKKRKPGHQPCRSKVLSLTGKSCKPQKVPFFSSKGKNTCVFMRKILVACYIFPLPFFLVCTF